MTIKFKCDACGASYEKPDSMAGKKAACRCGASLTIPTSADTLGFDDLESIASGPQGSPAGGQGADPPVLPPSDQMGFGVQGDSPGGFQPQQPGGQQQGFGQSGFKGQPAGKQGSANQTRPLQGHPQQANANQPPSSGGGNVVMWICGGVGALVVVVAIFVIWGIYGGGEDDGANNNGANNANNAAANQDNAANEGTGGNANNSNNANNANNAGTGNTGTNGTASTTLEPGALFMIVADPAAGGLPPEITDALDLEDYRSRLHDELGKAGEAQGVPEGQFAMLVFDEAGHQALAAAEQNLRRDILPQLSSANIAALNKAWEEFPERKTLEPQVAVRLGFIVGWDADPPEDQVMDAIAALVNAFKQNPDDVRRRYANSRIDIEGMITDVGRTSQGQSYVLLQSTEGADVIRCLTSDERPWATCAPGLNARVNGAIPPPGVGEGGGEDDETLALHECIVVTLDENPTPTLQAEVIAGSYIQSRLSIEQNYGDKYVFVTGNVESTSSGGTADQEVVKLVGANGIRVECRLQALQTGWAEAAETGAEVQFYGMLDKASSTTSMIVFSQCLPVSGMPLPGEIELAAIE